LAKRKAEELEDFGEGGADTVFAKHTKLETDQGTQLVKEFLDAWKDRIGQSGSGGGEDEAMMDEDAQVEELRKVAEEYREKFEASPWIKSLLEGF
jgi:DNA mismatch repair protein MSH2